MRPIETPLSLAKLLAFFDRHLLDHAAGVLEGPAAQYPQVLFESRRP